MIKTKSNLFMLLGLLTLLPITSSLCIDMYLPAFPTIAATFHVKEGDINLTMSIYLVGFAVGQIVYGLFADRFGRRKTLLFGLTLFSFASLACYLSKGYYQFFTARGFQALGACSATILTRAIVTDLFTSSLRTKMLALINAVNIISPGIAPLLGGYLLRISSWQNIFLIIWGFGLLMLVLTWFILPETLNPENKKNINTSQIKQDTKALFTSRLFVGYLVCVSFMYGTVFVWVTYSPDILISHLNVSPNHFGYYFILPAICSTLGALTVMRAINFLPTRTILSIGYTVVIAAALFLLGLHFTHTALNAFLVTLPVMFIFYINGLIQPIQINAAVTPFAAQAGYTMGVIGFTQGCVGGLVGMVTGIFYEATTLGMAIILFVSISIALAGFLITLKQQQ